jgi:hypothetical protein
LLRGGNCRGVEIKKPSSANKKFILRADSGLVVSLVAACGGCKAKQNYFQKPMLKFARAGELHTF